MTEERPLRWIGSSKSDYLAFPDPVKDEFGYALGVVQFGGSPSNSKSWKGEGPGIFELVESFDGNAYRTIYTVRFERAVYVLHAFQKKSPSGIRTALKDVQLVGDRLKRARMDYEARKADRRNRSH